MMEAVSSSRLPAEGTGEKRKYDPKKTTVREYVKVTSNFDRTGYMQPKTITWSDGRVFQIESVKDYYPLKSVSGYCAQDCYTVIIRGEERYLFFERVNELAAGRVGRWYVQVIPR